MTEIFRGNEGGQERPPLNEREVLNKFEELLEGREFTEKGKHEDENGIVSWDIMTLDTDGEPLEISYERARTFPSGVSTHPRITQTLFSGGSPCGSGQQFDYVDGNWVERF